VSWVGRGKKPGLGRPQLGKLLVEASNLARRMALGSPPIFFRGLPTSRTFQFAG
jgi:hypothetical protein